MKFLTILLLLAVGTGCAQAAVFRCVKGGKVTYTDLPCAAGTEPAHLPAINTELGDHKAPSLAKQYDADQKRNSDALAKADGAWLKKHEQDSEHDATLRKALVERRVVKGMTREQARQVLDVPQSIEDEGGPKERWIYQNGRERRTIAFKDGVVSGDTAHSGRK